MPFSRLWRRHCTGYQSGSRFGTFRYPEKTGMMKKLQKKTELVVFS